MLASLRWNVPRRLEPARTDYESSPPATLVNFKLPEVE
jgi:hypothetical protein